jgi:Transposase DDE domain
VRVLWALDDPEQAAYVGSSGSHATPWPHLRQLCRVERHRLTVRRGRVTATEAEVRYYVTSASPARADARALLAAIRGHWGIENRLHYVRDVTFDEDRCQVRGGAIPEVLAACRNLAIALLRRTGAASIAAGLRTYAGRPAAAALLVLEAGLTG